MGHNDLRAILTRIYGRINRIKTELAFEDMDAVWKEVNALSDYVVGIDLGNSDNDKDTLLIGD